MPKKKKTATSPLIDREQAMEILGASYSTLRRMELDRTLTPIKLRPKKHTAKVHYRKHQVYALIGEPLPT